jgi:hypothetical protein
MFTDELSKRPTLNYKQTMRSFQNRYNNDKTVAKRNECKRLLGIHASTSSSAMERVLATTILLNDRLELDKIKTPTPWEGSLNNQKQWLNQWRDEVESAAKAKFGGDLNKAKAAVLGPLAGKNERFLIFERQGREVRES